MSSLYSYINSPQLVGWYVSLALDLCNKRAKKSAETKNLIVDEDGCTLKCRASLSCVLSVCTSNLSVISDSFNCGTTKQLTFNHILQVLWSMVGFMCNQQAQQIIKEIKMQ